MNNINPLFI